MSRCTCEPQDRSRWRVTCRQGNHSAFNGYRFAPSRYSGFRCLGCLAAWRSRAGYASEIADMSRADWASIGVHLSEEESA